MSGKLTRSDTGQKSSCFSADCLLVNFTLRVWYGYAGTIHLHQDAGIFNHPSEATMNPEHAAVTEDEPFCPSQMPAAFKEFLAQYPTYKETTICDDLRASDYQRLDEQGHIYLDYTGGGLYAQSQLDAHMQMMSQGVFGNPHSHNPTSLAMTELVEEARSYVLSYFNTNAEEYVVIFYCQCQWCPQVNWGVIPLSARFDLCTSG